MNKSIFLVGYMGCGKSTVGRRLGRRLGMEFKDTDTMVEEMVGASVLDIFYYEGESKFRELELDVLKQLASINGQIIVATGGGLPGYGNNMKLLNELGMTFYLKCSTEQIIKRLQPHGLKKRPKLAKLNDDELFDFINDEISRRESTYMQAQYIVDCSIMGDNFIVEHIISNLNHGK